MTSMKKIRSLDQLAISIRNEPELEKRMKDDPAKFLDEVRSATVPNTRVYHIVVSSLGAAILVALVGAIAISLIKEVDNVPDILVATASAAVGALAGLLAPQPNGDQ